MESLDIGYILSQSDNFSKSFFFFSQCWQFNKVLIINKAKISVEVSIKGMSI